MTGKEGFAERSIVGLDQQVFGAVMSGAKSLAEAAQLTLDVRKARAKTKRGRRLLEARGPKEIEDVKHCLFIKGAKAGKQLSALMRDLYLYKKPHGILYSKKHEIRPFEDETQLLKYMERADAPAFIMFNHQKKRPENVIMGRSFNWQLYDMLEFGVENIKTLADFPGSKPPLGNKPLFQFVGDEFENNEKHRMLKNMILDIYRGEEVTSLALQGLSHIFCLTAFDENRVIFQTMRIVLKKSGTRIPRVEVENIGPNFDIVFRRHRVAPDDLAREALKQPAKKSAASRKNKEVDAMGAAAGRLYVNKQNLGKMQTRKMKGLKRKHTEEDDASDNEA
eukprot:Clim_evm73s109 gene=Clim_evmTU73s109